MALKTSLAAVFELNEASGNAVDSFASNTLTETSGTIDGASGPAGLTGSRDFEAGDTEYFTHTDNADLSAGDIEFTLSVWVNFESLGATRVILSKGTDIVALSGFEYAIYYSTFSSRFLFRVLGGSTNTSVAADVLGVPSTGVWYHIVAWHDPVANQIAIAVNAGTANTASHSAGVTDGTGDFMIGTDDASFGTARAMDGLVAQVALWKRVLTSDDRTALYALGNGLPYVSWDVVAGVTFDVATNSGYQAAASTYSWSHTCTGSNRFLAVDISMLSVPGTTVTSITYNSVPLTLIGAKSTLSGAGRVECWGLPNPSSGSNTIAVTLSASVISAGTAVSYTGVNSLSPTEAPNSAQATNVGATDATVSITTTTVNDWVHGAIATDDTSITANQTTRNNVTGAGGSAADEDTGPIASPGATTISYTGVGALATWAIAGYGIRPVNAGISIPGIVKATRQAVKLSYTI